MPRAVLVPTNCAKYVIRICFLSLNSLQSEPQGDLIIILGITYLLWLNVWCHLVRFIRTRGTKAFEKAVIKSRAQGGLIQNVLMLPQCNISLNCHVICAEDNLDPHSPPFPKLVT